MPVIALQGVRGGVGTTSVAAGLAHALHRLGETVLVIDFSQNNQLRLHFSMPFAELCGWARSECDGHFWQQGVVQFCAGLDFLPFGQLSRQEFCLFTQQVSLNTQHWQDKLAQIQASKDYSWIVLDVPADESILTQQALALADNHLIIINADANCHIRLHQQELPAESHFLVNQFLPTRLLQQDLYQLWRKTALTLLPLVVHHDEAQGEALAAKKLLASYRADSQVVDDLQTLAHWCLIHIHERQKNESLSAQGLQNHYAPQSSQDTSVQGSNFESLKHESASEPSAFPFVRPSSQESL